MAIYPKINGSYKEMTDCKVKVDGAWKQAKTIYAKVNGEWKEVWNSSIIVRLDKFLMFNIPIKGYDGTGGAVIKNVRLRLFNNYTNGVNECVAEEYFGDVTIAKGGSRTLEITDDGDYSWRVSASIDIYNSNVRISTTVMPMEDYAYGEFEYSSVIKSS